MPKRFRIADDPTEYEFPDDVSDDEAIQTISRMAPPKAGPSGAAPTAPQAKALPGGDALAVIGQTPLLPNLPKAGPNPIETGVGMPRPSIPRVGKISTILNADLPRLSRLAGEAATAGAKVVDPTLTRSERLGGASGAFRAAGEAALPYAAPLIAAPILGAGSLPAAGLALGQQALNVGAGVALQQGVERGARALGAGEGTSQFLGDLAGLPPLGNVGKVALRGWRALSGTRPQPPKASPQAPPAGVVPEGTVPTVQTVQTVGPPAAVPRPMGYLKGRPVSAEERAGMLGQMAEAEALPPVPSAMEAAELPVPAKRPRPAQAEPEPPAPAPGALPAATPPPPLPKTVPTPASLLAEPEVALPPSPGERPKFEVRDTPPKAPIDLPTLQSRYPGWKFQPEAEPVGNRAQVIWATTPGGGRIKISMAKGEIPVEPKEVEGALGRQLRQGERATGAYVPVEDLIMLGQSSDPSTFKYETFRWAFKNILKWKEREALLQEYGSETAAAEAFRDQISAQRKSGPLGKLVEKLEGLRQDWAKTPSAQATLMRLERDEIWKRSANQPGVAEPGGNFLKNLWNRWEQTRANALAGSNYEALRELDPEAQAGILKGTPGVGRVSARVQYIQTAPQVDEAMKGVRVKPPGEAQPLPGDWEVFKTVGMASRLEGARARWAQLAQGVREMAPEEFQAGLAKAEGAFGADGYLRRIVGELGEMDGSTARLDKLDDFLAAGKLDEAKAYLSRSFEHNAMEVPVPDLVKQFGRTLAEFAEDPDFQKALAIYKRGMEDPIRKAHLGNEGFLSDALGPLNTYFPLTAVRDDPALLGGSSVVKRARWERPVNPSNYFTYGLAKEYDTSNEAMLNAFANAYESNYRKVAMEYLVKRGLAVRTQRPVGRVTAIKGEPTEVVTFQIPSTGKGPSQWMAVPADIATQLKPLLEPSPMSDRKSKAHDLMNFLTGYSLLGLSDNRYNMSMMLNAADSGLPWFKRGWQNVWGLKTLVALKNVHQVATKELKTPEGQAFIREMAEQGSISPRSTAATTDPNLAKVTGLEYMPHPFKKDFWTKIATADEHERKDFALRRLAPKFLPEGSTDPISIAAKTLREKAEGAYGALSYGPYGVDTAVRYNLWKWHKAEFPDAGPIDRTAFVNQAGNYIWGLQTALERKVKASALGPFTSTFVTARLTNLRNGLRFAMLAAPPGLPSKLTSRESMGYRLGSAVSNGLLGMGMLNIIGSKIVSGKYPWEDPDYRLGYLHVPKGSAFAQHPAVQRFKGSDPNLETYIPLTALNPQLYRGLQGLGVQRGVEESLKGQRPQDAAVEGLMQSANTLIAPLASGPVLQAGATAFGRRAEFQRPWGDFVGDPMVGQSHLGRLAGYAPPSKTYREAIARGVVRSLGSLNQMGEPGIEALWNTRHLQKYRDESKHDYGDPLLQVAWQMIMPRTAPVAFNARKARELSGKIRGGRERQEKKIERQERLTKAREGRP